MEKLRRSSVMVVGVGGLGSTVSTLLARTGIGRLIVVDPDLVEEPDMNRQILYFHSDIGSMKVERARSRLIDINPALEVQVVPERLSPGFELPDVDVVVDCLDNFSSRFVLEDLVWSRGIPLVHGGVRGFSGQATTLMRGKTRRLREIFGEVEDPRESPQVFPPVVTLIGSVQASEVIKMVCGDEDGSLLNRLLLVDLGINSFEEIYLSPPPNQL